jgi:hypothetical protein
MARFCQLKDAWVNLDSIAWVDVRPGAANQHEPRCVVHFIGPGTTQEFLGHEAHKLLELLAKNAVEVAFGTSEQRGNDGPT